MCEKKSLIIHLKNWTHYELILAPPSIYWGQKGPILAFSSESALCFGSESPDKIHLGTRLGPALECANWTASSETTSEDALQTLSVVSPQH